MASSCLNECSIYRFLHKNLCYHPYKTQIAQECSEQGKVSRQRFYNKFLDLVKNYSDIVNTLLMSIKAHFHVSGNVNKQNCHYWAPNNPHELHQHPLHSAKVTVWCEVYAHGIICPYFFENMKGHTVTLNAEQYKFMLQIFLRIELQSARFAVVPTGWSNCSHSRNFHASPQDNVSGQTHFSFLGHHLARLLA